MRGRKPISREAILENLRVVARALGKTVLTCEDYKRHPLRRFCLATIHRKFKSWGNALHAVGLAPAQVHRLSTARLAPTGTKQTKQIKQPPTPQNGGCPRCCGLFQLVNILDGNGTPMQQWRCANCGEVLDDKIAENRRLCQPKKKRLLGQWPPAPDQHTRRLVGAGL